MNHVEATGCEQPVETGGGSSWDELEEELHQLCLNGYSPIYTIINDKLVGLLIRTRKHQLTYFEGEVLFQKRNDDVPVFLMQTIEDITAYCDNKALQARRSVSLKPQ